MTDKGKYHIPQTFLSRSIQTIQGQDVFNSCILTVHLFTWRFGAKSCTRSYNLYPHEQSKVLPGRGYHLALPPLLTGIPSAHEKHDTSFIVRLTLYYKLEISGGVEYT